MNRPHAHLSGAFVAAVLAACAARQEIDLVPAPTANVVAGVGDGAVDTASGVRVEARADAWQWNPADLERRVTPFLVHLENTGTSNVLVRYNNFRVTTAGGERHSAMPPYDVNSTITESHTVRNPFYPYSRFALAPYLRLYYPLWLTYDGIFTYDQLYYDPFLTTYRRIQLPTADMVRRALPEGVLQPGGKVSGFVYFEHVDDDTPRLEFTFDLVDAVSNRQIASASIPFVTAP